MTVHDDDAREPEQLAGGDGPRVNWTAVAVAVVLVAGAVLLAHAAQHDTPANTAHRHRSLPPAPAPTAATRPVHAGSVFFERMLGCTRTDHRHRLSVAFGVTNLGSRPLTLLGA